MAETYSDYLRGLGRSAAQGLTFGFADEAEAAIRALGDETYEEAVAEIRADLEQFRETNPISAFGAEFAGAIPSAAGLAGLALRSGVRGAAKIGAAEGALYGLGIGEGVEGRAKEAVIGAGLGAAGGAVLEKAYQGIAPIVGRAMKLRGSGIETRGAGEVMESPEVPEGLLPDIPFSDRGPMPLPETGKNRTTGLTPKGTRPGGLGTFGVNPPFKAMSDRVQGGGAGMLQLATRSDAYSPIVNALVNASDQLGAGRKGLTGTQYLKRLKRLPSVTDAELERSGLASFLADNKNTKISPTEVLEEYNQKAPQIVTQVRSDQDTFEIYDNDGNFLETIDADDYRAADYGYDVVLHKGDQRLIDFPRIENEYREIIYADANIPNYADVGPYTHYGEVDGNFAHARVVDVSIPDADVDGRSSLGLFVEEVQSDIEKAYRDAKRKDVLSKKGRLSDDEKAELEELNIRSPDLARFVDPNAYNQAVKKLQTVYTQPAFKKAEIKADERKAVEDRFFAAQRDRRQAERSWADLTTNPNRFGAGGPALADTRSIEYDRDALDGMLEDINRFPERFTPAEAAAEKFEIGKRQIALGERERALDKKLTNTLFYENRSFFRDMTTNPALTGLLASPNRELGDTNLLIDDLNPAKIEEVFSDQNIERAIDSLIDPNASRLPEMTVYADPNNPDDVLILGDEGVQVPHPAEKLINDLQYNFTQRMETTTPPSATATSFEQAGELAALTLEALRRDSGAKRDLRAILNELVLYAKATKNQVRAGEEKRSLDEAIKLDVDAAFKNAGIDPRGADATVMTSIDPAIRRILASARSPGGLLSVPPFADQASMSAYLYRDIVARAMREGYSSVVFPDYRDVASLRVGADQADAYKLSYKDVRDKVIKELQTQYGDAVGTRKIDSAEFDDFGGQDFRGRYPVTVVDLPSPSSRGEASSRNVVPRGYAKGGHVRAGIGELFRLYS